MGMVNFRDALEHLAKVLRQLEEGDIEGAKGDVAEMEAHLFRAAYDGAQTVPEAKIEYIKQNRLPSILYKITLVEAPGDREYRRQKNQITDLISKGRQCKPKEWERSVKYFEDATRLATNLEENTPPKKDVYYRMIILCISVLSIVLTVGFSSLR